MQIEVKNAFSSCQLHFFKKKKKKKRNASDFIKLRIIDSELDPFKKRNASNFKFVRFFFLIQIY